MIYVLTVSYPFMVGGDRGVLIENGVDEYEWAILLGWMRSLPDELLARHGFAKIAEFDERDWEYVADLWA